MTVSVGVCLLMLVGDEVTAVASIATSVIDRTPTMVYVVWVWEDLYVYGIRQEK